MAQNSTPLSLLAYLYRETTPDKSRAIQRELAMDVLLREQYLELEQAARVLPKVSFAPSDLATGNILQYSRSPLSAATV